jgi:hypothetical protein
MSYKYLLSILFTIFVYHNYKKNNKVFFSLVSVSQDQSCSGANVKLTYAAGPESQGHSRTGFANISMSSCFPSFIVRWILNFVDQPTHENHKNWYPTNKSDFTVCFFLGGYSTTNEGLPWGEWHCFFKCFFTLMSISKHKCLIGDNSLL